MVWSLWNANTWEYWLIAEINNYRAHKKLLHKIHTFWFSTNFDSTQIIWSNLSGTQNSSDKIQKKKYLFYIFYILLKYVWGKKTKAVIWQCGPIFLLIHAPCSINFDWLLPILIFYSALLLHLLLNCFHLYLYLLAFSQHSTCVLSL